MRKTQILALLAFSAAVHTAGAVSIVGFVANESGTPADVTFDGFSNGPQAGIAIPGGTLSYDGAVIVQSDGNSSGAIPWPTVNGAYLSVMRGGTATFDFTSPLNSFGFQWGSIDNYNTIAFFLGATPQGSFTGTQVVISPVAANGGQGLNGSAFVTFGGSFDKVVLTSTSNSFEIDNVKFPAGIPRVPDGGMTVILLGLSLSGFAFFRRKFGRV